MKETTSIPKILKINSVKGFIVCCIFNNGETRIIDFQKLFDKWEINKQNPEYILLNEKEFKKVSLINQTLSWKNIKIELLDFENNKTSHPFEIDPYVLYKNSVLAG